MRSQFPLIWFLTSIILSKVIILNSKGDYYGK